MSVTASIVTKLHLRSIDDPYNVKSEALRFYLSQNLPDKAEAERFSDQRRLQLSNLSSVLEMTIKRQVSLEALADAVEKAWKDPTLAAEIRNQR